MRRSAATRLLGFGSRCSRAALPALALLRLIEMLKAASSRRRSVPALLGRSRQPPPVLVLARSVAPCLRAGRPLANSTPHLSLFLLVPGGRDASHAGPADGQGAHGAGMLPRLLGRHAGLASHAGDPASCPVHLSAQTRCVAPMPASLPGPRRAAGPARDAAPPVRRPRGLQARPGGAVPVR